MPAIYQETHISSVLIVNFFLNETEELQLESFLTWIPEVKIVIIIIFILQISHKTPFLRSMCLQ